MIARLHIEILNKNNRSVLGRLYNTVPFKVANITEDKKTGPLELMIMSSSPGILDGDDYKIELDLAEQTSLYLHTQSYQRLFTMKNAALQHFIVNMKSGSSLTYLPHPAVPHAGSNFVNTNRFYLQENCRLMFGEILTCGRKLNGEIFSFSKYHTITEVFINSKLVVKENLFIEPANFVADNIGQMEGHTHQASFICINEKLPAAVEDEVHEFIAEQAGIIGGISALPVKGFIVRLLGQKAEQLHSLLKGIAEIASKSTSKMLLTSA